MIRKMPAPDLIGVETGFPKSMPSGLTRGIMLHQKINIDRSRLR
jgi:hypothetical protein